ncbi:hypothetical protein D3C81_1744670 [compost metagenome]
MLVILACLASLARFGAGNVHDFGASLEGRVLLVIHCRADGLDAGTLKLQVAALTVRTKIPSR